ncbi:hypothetical protein B0H19DRAFT_1275613 [Mycena capillaripes]|nr:hypothetical protein B0H19DRAFT_1275613 [Mycena capillaripes]
MKFTSSFLALIATIGISAVSATPLTNGPATDGTAYCALRRVTKGHHCHKYAECFTLREGKNIGGKRCCKNSPVAECAQYLTDPDCKGYSFIEGYQFCEA